MRSAAQTLVDQLLIHGCDHVFCVPGESYLPALDALYLQRERIRLIVNRHESGSGFMAEAYGKLTGKPGVAMVTRGPGAANVSIAVHTAHQDSTPMIVFIGQVGSDMFEREAFQEVDYRFMFARLAKWVAQIDRADRIPEFIARAYSVAQSGRPGPVVLALPEDMLSQTVDVADAKPAGVVQASPAAEDVARLCALLSTANNPLVIAGGPGWTCAACKDLRTFIEAWNLPVACAFRFQDTFDHAHPNYVGDVGIGINPALAKRVKDADVLLVLGARLGEMTTSGYTLLEVPTPKQTLVHVHADANELNRVYQAVLPMCSGMPQMAAALAASIPSPARRGGLGWGSAVESGHRDFEQWQTEPTATKTSAFNLWQVVQTLKKHLPANTLIANGAGNFATWAHRFWRYGGIEHHGRTQLAPTSGAMGYGMPAGIAAALIEPHKQTVIFAGDGDFLMTGQELATAVQYGAAPLILVFNNGLYGTIRMHQARDFPGHVSGTQLRNPQFAELARAYGAWGLRVTNHQQFEDALTTALTHLQIERTPALIEMMTDPQLITPSSVLTD
jgi:acetolactate synthase I/II/III large subunit